MPVVPLGVVVVISDDPSSTLSSAAVADRAPSPGAAAAEDGRGPVLEQARVLVWEAVQLDARNFLPDEVLDRRDLLGVLTGHDGEGVPHALGAARAADPVNVVLGMVRHVVVDDVARLFYGKKEYDQTMKRAAHQPT